MATFLFHELVFGPVKSRRLGVSLGINLLPRKRKVCSFNCIYCECGWSDSVAGSDYDFPGIEEVEQHLRTRLAKLMQQQSALDAITFAGNGEPTLHPAFPEIIDITLRLRDEYCPSARVAVLSNASRIGNDKVFNALLKIDLNILKLDAGTDTTCMLINNPEKSFKREETINNLIRFNGKLIIQSLFFRGTFNGYEIDNTLPQEINQWYADLAVIKPSLVMIYTIERDTPAKGLQKIPVSALKEIAKKVNVLGIETQISG